MSTLVSRLTVIADGAEAAVSLALHDTADFILTLIRLYAPVQTGFLRDSYQKESIEQLHILIGTMVLYGIFQEFGTHKMASHPHITPAFLQAGDFMIEQMKKRMMELG